MLPPKEEQDSQVRLISRVFNNEWSVWSDEFDRYEQGYNYLAGEQYTPSQKAWYDSQRRPTNVWNIIFPVFNRILGDFLLNQIRERVFTKSGGDPFISRLLEKMIETVSLNTDYKDEMAQTLLAGLIKRGYIYARFSNERDLDGSIVITNIDEFEIMFDSRCIDPFCDDGMYMIRSKWLTTDQLIAKWPNHRAEFNRVLRDREESSYWEATNEFDSAMLNHKNFMDESNGRYRVIEFHHRVWEPAEILIDPASGDMEVLTMQGERRELLLAIKPNYEIVETDNAEIIRIDEVVPALAMFLNRKNADIQDKKFDYIPFSPYNYGKLTVKNFGIFANSIGPQDEFNNTRNRMLDIINKAANAQTAVKPNAIRNWKQVKSHGNQPGLFIEVKSEENIADVYKRFDPPTNPYANEKLADSSFQLLHRIIGVTENLQGQTQTSQENASLFAQRVQEAQKAFVPIDRSQKRVSSRLFGRVVKLLQHNYNQKNTKFMLNSPLSGEPDEIILNQQAGDFIMNDITTGEYMVKPSVSQFNQTLRAMEFMQKTELVQLVAGMVGPEGINFRWWLENSEFSDIEKFIEAIEQAQAAVTGQNAKAAAGDQLSQLMQLAAQSQSLQGGGVEQGQPAARGNQNKKTEGS
jgi:hypothetical protein